MLLYMYVQSVSGLVGVGEGRGGVRRAFCGGNQFLIFESIGVILFPLLDCVFTVNEDDHNDFVTCRVAGFPAKPGATVVLLTRDAKYRYRQ